MAIDNLREMPSSPKFYIQSYYVEQDIHQMRSIGTFGLAESRPGLCRIKLELGYVGDSVGEDLRRLVALVNDNPATVGPDTNAHVLLSNALQEAKVQAIQIDTFKRQLDVCKKELAYWKEHNFDNTMVAHRTIDLREEKG